jgi:hypothetical protein
MDCFRMLAGLAVVMTVTGCVTTQPQADGSTKVSFLGWRVEGQPR